ncbi:GNAT family N-acetyltransferase [bacterium]|nr:GNAT family N-acetyltransferase [bacterium]
MTSRHECSLRPATREDLPRLEAWSRDFEHGRLGAPFIASTLAAFERAPERGEVLIVERERKPLGYAILVSFWSNEFRGEALLLDELYVAPEHRGGTGARVLELIEERARRRRIRHLALEVLPGESRVARLYERAGFTTSNRSLYKKVLGDARS